MNSENSESSCSHKLIISLANRINLKGSDEYAAFSNLSICFAWKNIKSSDRNKLKLSIPAWNDKFDLLNGSFSKLDI